MPSHTNILWQELNRDRLRLSPDQFRIDAAKFDKGSRRRLLMAYVLVLLSAAQTVFMTILRSHYEFFDASEWIGLAYVALVAFTVGLTVRARPRLNADIGQTVRLYRTVLEFKRDSG